jgi:hypothetical protein
MSIRIVKRDALETRIHQGTADQIKGAAEIRREMAGTVLSWIREQSRGRELAYLKARLFMAHRVDEEPES